MLVKENNIFKSQADIRDFFFCYFFVNFNEKWCYDSNKYHNTILLSEVDFIICVIFLEKAFILRNEFLSSPFTSVHK